MRKEGRRSPVLGRLSLCCNVERKEHGPSPFGPSSFTIVRRSSNHDDIKKKGRSYNTGFDYPHCHVNLAWSLHHCLPSSCKILQASGVMLHIRSSFLGHMAAFPSTRTSR